MYRNFDELISALQNDTTKRRCAVASAADKHTLEAVVKANLDGIIEPVLIGDVDKIIMLLREMGVRPDGFEIIPAADEEESAQIACDLVNQGKASAIMKGLMETSTIMRAVLKKENNLRASGLLSAVSLLEIQGYHKLLLTTDPGLNMYPDVDASPMDIAPYQALKAIVDIIYNPTTTKLLAQAKERGITAVNGLEMLVAQAKYAVELFLDNEFSDDRIDEVMKTLFSEA